MKKTFGLIFVLLGVMALSICLLYLSGYLVGKYMGCLPAEKGWRSFFLVLSIWSTLLGIFMIIVVTNEVGLRVRSCWPVAVSKMKSLLTDYMKFSYSVYYSAMIKPRLWFMNGLGFAFLLLGFTVTASWALGVLFLRWSLFDLIPNPIEFVVAGVTSGVFGMLIRCSWQLIKRQAHYDWDSPQSGQ